MKRASYRHAVEFIALNDSPADDPPAVADPRHPDNDAVVDAISGYASVVLVSEIFDVEQRKVARDVLRARIDEAKQRGEL